MSLLDLAQRRLLIVTGKGGVGKSTLSAALALAIAKRGRRVLCTEVVPSPDTPSQLANALGTRDSTEEPVLVSTNLWLALLTPTIGHHRFLQDALPFKLLADAAMKSQGVRKFLSAAPGFSDMGVLYRLIDLMRRTHPSGGPLFDLCIVDSPATGHALALAQIPAFLMRVIPGGPIHRLASEGVRVLSDPAMTAAIVVTLPEILPVTESLELEQGLARHGLPVSGIVVNRVPKNPFSVDERRALDELLKVHSNVLGTRELNRISRAIPALKLLDERAPGRSIFLPEVAGDGFEATKNLSPLI
jgi:anion-transporting  ArsA/GET3 family ATPase